MVVWTGNRGMGIEFAFKYIEGKLITVAKDDVALLDAKQLVYPLSGIYFDITECSFREAKLIAEEKDDPSRDVMKHMPQAG